MGSSRFLVKRQVPRQRKTKISEDFPREIPPPSYTKNEKRPGSMNSTRNYGNKYLVLLSMAVNVILLSNFLYDKGMQHSNAISSVVPQRINWLWVWSNRGQRTNPLIFSSIDALQKLHLPNNHQAQLKFCKECNGCMSGHNCSSCVSACTINLDHGDPTMFESFWLKNGQKSTFVLLGWQSMSYFADVSNICWFLEPSFAKEIKALHNLVGNAVTEGRYIVVGTGSTQLFQAALYALSPSDRRTPTKIVSASPYYSSYPAVTDYLKSELYRWGGDALKFKKTLSAEDSYIELVTSPNNPDGYIRKAVVNASGPVIHDYAYYWPQYTPITESADEDIMLFTVSKSTGHAGSRIGWAIVKDPNVAKKMTKFIELNTIGVAKDSQLRAAQILRSVTESHLSESGSKISSEFHKAVEKEQRFFHYSYSLMAERWNRLQDVAKVNKRFSIPSFEPAHCNFFGRYTSPQPAFAWIRCQGSGEVEEDCEKLLKDNGILTRSGRHFGASKSYVRVSIIDRSRTFDLLVDRLSTIE